MGGARPTNGGMAIRYTCHRPHPRRLVCDDGWGSQPIVFLGNHFMVSAFSGPPMGGGNVATLAYGTCVKY